jgi:hypothetical protein
MKLGLKGLAIAFDSGVPTSTVFLFSSLFFLPLPWDIVDSKVLGG